MKIPVETFLKNVDGQQRKKTQFDVISLDAENWTGLTQLKEYVPENLWFKLDAILGFF